MRFGYALLGLITLTSIHISRGKHYCGNGFEGVQKDDSCCDKECGECGGRGCAGRPGGRENCCTSVIESSGSFCSVTGEAPCIVDTQEFICCNGLHGVQAANNPVCCEADCGTCGGSGCAGRPGGADACCVSSITNSGVLCNDTEVAPCIVGEEKFPVCSNGVPGVESNGVCCEAQCGTCGGRGCAQRPGGSVACCIGRIRDSDISCTDNNKAPCII